jgi:outer membrane protein
VTIKALRILSASLIIMGAGTQTASAQDGCLDFSEAVSRASKFSPRAAASDAASEELGARMDGVRGGWRPQLSAFARTGSGDTGLVDNQIENQTGVRLSQRLYDFNRSKLQRQSLAAEQARVKSEAALTRLTSAEESAGQFIEAARSERLAEILRAELDYLRQLKSRLDTLDRSGGVTGSELADAAAQIAGVEAGIIEIEMNGALAADSIAHAIGVPTINLCKAQSFSGAAGTLVIAPEDYEQALETLSDSDPALAAAGHAVEAAQFERDYVKRQRLPELAVEGIMSYSYDDAMNDWDWRDRVGLSVSTPLLSGGTLRANEAAAASRVKQAELNRLALQSDRLQQLTRTYRMHQSIGAQRKVRQEAVRQKRIELDYASRGHDQGLITLSELIEVRSELSQQEIALVNLEYDLALTAYGFRVLTGISEIHEDVASNR